MKTILKVLVAVFIFGAVFNAINLPEQSQGGRSHTLIQRAIEQDLSANLNYPDSLVLMDYDFVSLGGDTGKASYTFKAKNAMGLYVHNTAYLVVVMNDDLTIKEYGKFVIK